MKNILQGLLLGTIFVLGGVGGTLAFGVACIPMLIRVCIWPAVALTISYGAYVVLQGQGLI